MIISHRLKFAFFRIPKTGSTTMSVLLHQAGVLGEGDVHCPLAGFGVKGSGDFDWENREIDWVHMTPTDAVAHGVLTEQQLREYTCVAALRDPYSRYISGFAHAHAGRPLMNPHVFRTAVLKGQGRGILYKPQTDYFYHNGELVLQPINFEDFENAVQELLVSIGGSRVPVMLNFNVTRGKGPEMSRKNLIDSDPEVKALLTARLATDIELYKSHFGAV